MPVDPRMIELTQTRGVMQLDRILGGSEKLYFQDLEPFPFASSFNRWVPY
jgi:hypothetical protein